MSSDDDDLPEVLGSSSNVRDPPVEAPRLKIDVDYEIKQSLIRKEQQRRITAEQKKFESVLPAQPKHYPIKEPKITAFPTSRTLFYLDRSQKAFNADSLSLKQSCPNDYCVLASENWIEFFQWIRVRLQNFPSERRSILLYLWCQQSVNPDQHIIFKCHDLLLEFNDSWRLKWEEVILLFWNWGGAESDFVSHIDVAGINSKLKERELIVPYNIECVSSLSSICVFILQKSGLGLNANLEGKALVSSYNIDCTLNILKEQLQLGDLDGEKDFKKTTFILLSLLSLDFTYSSSVYAIQNCLEAFATFSPLKSWVSDYCEGIFKVEQNHPQITYLAQCILPASVRRCISFAFCHVMLSLQPIFVEKPEPASLRDLLKKFWKDVVHWDSYEIHSFVTLVDCIVDDYITKDTSKEIRSDLLLWLRNFYQTFKRRPRDDVDVDSTVVEELLSRLETEWEESWTDISEGQDYFNDVIDELPSSEDDD